MHPEFASALLLAPVAKASLIALPPGQQREYLQWIGEAKRTDTRAKRIAKAIDWLNDGKSRNWKYEKR